MKIGLFTSGYQRYQIEQAFKDATRFGYDFIELWGGRPDGYVYDILEDQGVYLKSLISKYSMPIYIYTPEMNAYPFNFMVGSEKQRQSSVHYVCKCIEAAVLLGAEYTLISAGHAGYYRAKKEVEERLILSLKEIATFAEKNNHKVILEALTHFESNVINKSSELKWAIDEVNSPFLVGMIDVVPPFVIQEPVIEYFNKLGNKIVHMHVVDSDGYSDTHMIPNEGKIPLKELLMEVKNMDFEPTITIELVTAYLNEPSLYAKKAIDQLNALLYKG